MRDLVPPFRFDLSNHIKKARRKFNTRVGSVSISIPFLSFSLNPDDLETRVAREIVIRMADRRVLNANECCDNCIAQALESLQEIRRFLVDKQVELSGATDGVLYLLIELQLEAIRQFLTFVERQSDGVAASLLEGHPVQHHLPSMCLVHYFAAFEMIRSHLYRCLFQISKIASIEIPKISSPMRYDEAWQLEAYEPLKSFNSTDP